MSAVATSYTVHPFAFRGRGSEYFGIWFVNVLLTALTLGLYYPWARANRLRYLAAAVELDGARFVFHGTGAEIFRGFIKVWLVLALFWGMYVYAVLTRQPFVLVGLVLVLLVAVVGLLGALIHGAVRYRASRTAWRGLRFGYDGDRGELTRLCIKGVLLTAATFGIYSFWFINDLRRYVLGHLRYGTARFSYRGSGSDLFVLGLKSVILSPLTLGMWLIEYRRERLAYLFNQLRLRDGDTATDQGLLGRAVFHTGYGFLPLFGLLLTNVLLIVFTLGLGFPWAVMRSWSYVINNLTLAGDLDFELIGRGALTDQGAGADAALDVAGIENAVDLGDFGLI